MALPWGIAVPFVIGVAYGWLKPGRQNTRAVIRTGLVLGFILAILLAAIGLLIEQNPLGLGPSPVNILLAVLALALLFVLGVWVGDWIESRAAKPGA